MTPFANGEKIRVGKSQNPIGSKMSKFDIYHNYYGIGFRLTGESVISTLDQNFVVQEGDVVLINNEFLHRTSYQSEIDITGFRIQFDTSVYERLYKSIGKNELDNLFQLVVIHIKEDKKEKVKSLFEKMEEEYRNDFLQEHNPYSNEILYSMLHILFMNLLRYQTSQTDAKISALPFQNTLSRAISYMERAYANDPSIKETAHYCNVSDSYLSKLFKQYFEMNYSEYLNKIKVHSAKRLLAKTNCSLNDIALQCGFSSQNYFNYVFKKEVQISPLQYRKSLT